MSTIELTEKQAEYVRNAHSRWNFAVGAVRSGKSHVACTYAIPNGIISRKGKKGINLILGVSKETIERNVLTPMRDVFGGLVGDINSRNVCRMFGEQVYCIGAEKVSQVSKLRGSEVKFCYVDEVCDINGEVFEMLKSRLSLPYSECHAACNPQSPQHFVKRFLDTDGLDLFYQHYTIDDNPFLPPAYVDSLKAEYAGTVYYKRYIDGLWTQAEGLIYPNFEQAFEPDFSGECAKFCISCDYGTQNAFAALLWGLSGETWHLLKEYRFSGRDEGHQKTDADYLADMVGFCAGLPQPTEFIVDPSAASFIAALRSCGEHRFKVRKAQNAVLDGIRNTSVAMQRGLIKIGEGCKETRREFEGYVWDSSANWDKPVKVNDHMMDALRYFVSTKKIVRQRTDYVPVIG